MISLPIPVPAIPAVATVSAVPTIPAVPAVPAVRYIPENLTLSHTQLHSDLSGPDGF